MTKETVEIGVITVKLKCLNRQESLDPVASLR